MWPVTYTPIFDVLIRREREEQEGERRRRQELASQSRLVPPLRLRMQDVRETERRRDEGLRDRDGFTRIQACRDALRAIDQKGWNRSFHQRQFHDDFLRACARVFWKTEQAGQFSRDHQRILELNGWDHLAQEILVSTPRRFGKTISVSMFAAAMMFAAPNVEVSIYSTCKRISQKLLRNIQKFLYLIYEQLGVEPYKVIRMNMEEVVLNGPESNQDVRIVNSYPSKVSSFSPAPTLLSVSDPQVSPGIAPARHRTAGRAVTRAVTLAVTCAVTGTHCQF